MSDKYLTLEEVCKVLDKNPATIKRYARENLLSSKLEGDVLTFPESEVLRYLSFSKKLG